MKHSAIVLLARISIILLTLLGLGICIYVIPFRLYQFFVHSTLEAAIADGDGAYLLVPLVFNELAALPSFGVLVIGWLLTEAIKRDAVFTKPTARLFRAASRLLFWEAAAFLLAHIVFVCLGWRTLYELLLYAAVCVVFMVFALMTRVLSQFIDKAADIQAENDSFL